MSWDDEFWFPHTVNVRDSLEGGSMGGGHGNPRPLRAEVKDEQRLVRTDDGSEAVSSSTVTVPLDSGVVAGSLVTVWPGTPHEREASVIAVQRDENDPDLGSHLILSLQ